MCDWWVYKSHTKAKLTEAKDGSYIMWMEGAKYPFPGYPRGHLLFKIGEEYGSLSRMKHEIKVQIFNDAWAKLEDGVSDKEVVKDIKKALKDIVTIGHEFRHDFLPIEYCAPSVREFHRAWTKVGGDDGLRDILCFIFQEDDAYRWRFQWLVKYLKHKDPISSFEKGMDLLEHAEVTDDQKGFVRLWKRIILVLLRDDPTFFQNFLKELNIRKSKLSKADKYFFRAKYFKVDYPNYEY